MLKLLSCLSLFLFTVNSFSQEITLRGHISLPDGESGAFAAINNRHLPDGHDHGVTCDENGEFRLMVSPGKNLFQIRLIGYLELDTILYLSGHQKQQSIHFSLKENPAILSTVQVIADPRNLAREVMQHAIDAREAHLGRGSALRYKAYTKNSASILRPDTAVAGKDSLYLSLKEKDRPIIRLQTQVIETISEIHYTAPRSLHEEIEAYENHMYESDMNDMSVSINVEYGENDIIPEQNEATSSSELTSQLAYQEFNLYQRSLDIPQLCEKKILSPIGEGALLSYQFSLENIYFIDTCRVYVIRMKPVFPGEPLFNGTVHIRSDNWSLIQADIYLNKNVLLIYDSFGIFQQYEKGPAGHYMSVKDEFRYLMKDGRETTECLLIHHRFDIESDTSGFAFKGETKTYRDDAFDRDSLYWERSRLEELNSLEIAFAHKQDSLARYYTSEAYYEETDSAYNRLRFMDFILYGVGYRNREKKYSFGFDPLIAQINPVGIGGYRHRFGAQFQKEFENAFTLESDGMVDYGFKNSDVRGKGGIGLTYVPKKFVRTYLRFGDYYDMINTYASLGSVFSRSNYVRTQMFSIAQRMEVINGLFAELTFEFSDQQPINNMKQDIWSQQLFGDINKPIDFERYIKSEFRLDLKYRIAQKYQIRKNKKILLGSKYPELNAVYRKGVPGLLESEVNFDYIEVGAKHDLDLGGLGQMEWAVIAGSFVNKKNLRVLEHRYFRGSDPIFFSDPLRSFQLLGPTLSTSSAFIRANYFHHFNGIVLNKIPLLHRLKLTEAAGAAFLSIPDQGFFHAEFYAGLERIIRIRRDIFRLGVYASTADSSWNKARFEFKIGLNFYDYFRRKWNY